MMKMRKKITNGYVIISIGMIHTAFTLVFYKNQFGDFANHFFFSINKGFMETQINYETFSAFWCLFFGLLLFPLGFLLNSIEIRNSPISKYFILSYLSIILIGVYMIPLGGMTVFMLPHAMYMVFQRRNKIVVAS